MIGIVDYGAGNLRSVVNAFRAIDLQPVVTDDVDVLSGADAIVLPGVGAFRDGMEGLRRADLIDPLAEMVVSEGKPFLGICLGLQFLAEKSLEHGEHEGLGWLPGVVTRIRPEDPSCRVPHIGWNDVIPSGASPLFPSGSPGIFYFVHSYAFEPACGHEGLVTATTDHGGPVTAAVGKDNIQAIQFHPEKSQQDGLDLLRAFATPFLEVRPC